MRLQLGRDVYPGVLHRQAHPADVRLRGHGNLAAGGREFQGIGEQVSHHPAALVGVDGCQQALSW